MVVTPPAQGSRQISRAIIPFAIAAVAGVIHGIFSVYWGFGGNWLLETIGARLVNAFEGRRWLLLIVAAVKLGFAVVPLAWTLRGWPRHWIWRIGCELGALSLIVWGGANTVVFDAALNYLWDQTIIELRQRVSGYDLDYFFAIAEKDPVKRNKLNDVVDLSKIDDFDLIRAAGEIELITEVGHAPTGIRGNSLAPADRDAPPPPRPAAR
ncbi:hypothetical protein CGZ98_03380 [Enemella evansiae]|uniref:DUF3995 domain-containing protein n=1 Tax=Enemella evansiae TaxID=2016499 RepID=UPI000B9754BB|nr:DUF3995 domain-containing protein [Enemella evansiae]OYO15461.1 hypothetical protein CGZ98_03380 [Enemella evansiae]